MRARLERLRREQRGATLTELLVGMSAGLVVLLGLTTLVILTLHTTTRVSARVDATQRARIVLTRILDQLHSACIAPKAPPIREGSSSTTLRFVHASGKSAIPTPVLTHITLTGTTLTQTDYPYKTGPAPAWEFDMSKPATRPLMTHVMPLSASRPVFSYYRSLNGSINPVPQAGTGAPPSLSITEANQTIYIGIAFKAAPTSGPNQEETTPAGIEGGATLRLTPPSFNKEAPGAPCV